MMTTYCKTFHEWSQATNELHEFLEQREQTKLLGVCRVATRMGEVNS